MQLENMAGFLLENLDEIVIVFGENGAISYANTSAIDKLMYENIYNQSIIDIFPNEFSKENGAITDQIKIGEMCQFEAYRENRTCFTVEGKFTKEPKTGQFVVMVHDATEGLILKRQIEQTKTQAEEAGKVKSEFVANVTHELRTPVNGILGNTRELVELEEDQAKKRLLSLIERGCADMNAIINNILDFSKLDAGKFTLEKREFNFREMIDYVKANHKNKIIEKGLDFVVTVAPDVPETVVGDELRIVQILNNLLSNASKFTSVGRIVLEVVLTARVNNRVELFFLVIDTGIGIDKAGQDKLFKSFSQVDASISRKFGGTGLGLNISKQLVELMDGDIHVESEYGKGSMFSFHVWVDLPEGAATDGETTFTKQFDFSEVFNEEESNPIWNYGTAENLDEIKKKLSKLILSVEMDNWEKAENFADTIKQLTQSAPQEIKSQALRLKMSVQKSDYDKTTAAYNNLSTLLEIE